MKLTKLRKALLERIQKDSGKVMVLNLGGYTSDVNALLAAGYTEVVDHPTIMDRRENRPAAALAITDAGRSVLK